MYHPFIDNVNLGYIGITGALAWELPSKPFYPDEALQQAYEGGGLPLIDRNDNDTYLNKDDNVNKSETYTYNKDASTTGTPINIGNYQSNYYANKNSHDSYYKKNYDNYYRNNESNNNKNTREQYYSNRPNYYYNQATKPQETYFDQIPKVIDKFSNKMDYYFSYADKLLSTIKDFTSNKRNPWENVHWDTQSR